MTTPSAWFGIGFGLAALLAATAGARAQPKLLCEQKSRYNTIVVTEDQQGLRTLRFGKNGPRQSVVKIGNPDHLELSYVRTMLVSLALVEEPERILVIGLGGGTIPSFLHRHYPQATIDAVDIDPDVVAVARKYFGFQEDARLKAHVADGRQFIEQCAQPYDLILLDAFGTDSIPYHLATREFLQAVRRALTPKGLAVGNLWTSPVNPLYAAMVRTYQDVFEAVYLLDVPRAGNQILFAFPRPQKLKRSELTRAARAVSRRKQFPLDLSYLVRRGFRSAGKPDRRGRVLFDQAKETKPPGDFPDRQPN